MRFNTPLKTDMDPENHWFCKGKQSFRVPFSGITIVPGFLEALTPLCSWLKISKDRTGGRPKFISFLQRPGVWSAACCFHVLNRNTSGSTGSTYSEKLGQGIFGEWVPTFPTFSEVRILAKRTHASCDAILG